jgi:hypothetical protein
MRQVASDGADAPDAVRVLFVGNSLTYYNDLPAKFAALYAASRRGAVVQTEMLAAGGASLRDRLEDASLAKTLSAGDFDLVVLQDFGGWPLCSPEIPACETGSRSLRESVSLVRRHGARAVWFATWTSPRLQPQLTNASSRIAAELGVDWADVGNAMREASGSAPDLLHADGHPDVQGSWLAAITLLRQTQPELQLVGRDITACGRVWRDTDLRGDMLASAQAERVEHCDRLDAGTLRALWRALD